MSNLQSLVYLPDASYLDAVRNVLGIIDLDPCSSGRVQSVVQAQGWFRADQAEAALAESWSGSVFLHPHPSARMARRQLQKLLRDYLNDRVTEAIILSGQQDILRQEPLLLDFPFVFHYQRLKYWRWCKSEDKYVSYHPSTNNITVYLPRKNGIHMDDESIKRFTDEFRRYGRVVLTQNPEYRWQDDAMRATMRWQIKPVLTNLYQRP